MRIRARSLGGIAALVAACALAPAPAARADFTETFCSGGTPAAPWVLGGGIASPWGETNDTCSDPGGAYGFDNAANPLPGGRWSAVIDAPPGEVFTHEALQFSTQMTESNADFVVFGDGQSSTLAEFNPVDTSLTDSVDAALPDATQIWTRYDCDDAANGCPLANFLNVLAIGPMALTIHDTGAPTVTPAGGSLATGGTVKGTQSLIFHAADVGSGVAAATVSLGTTVVGTSQSACQAGSLTPCPGSVSGTIAANTALVPDGTYPVILTASDASGDQTPVQVATVTVRNRVGTTTVANRSRRSRHPRVDVHAIFHWDVLRHRTRLNFVTVARLPRRGAVSLACTGRRCPFHRLIARSRTLTQFKRRLHRRLFSPGQRLRFTATAPHRSAQRATLTIRRTRLPKIDVAR